MIFWKTQFVLDGQAGAGNELPRQRVGAVTAGPWAHQPAANKASRVGSVNARYCAAAVDDAGTENRLFARIRVRGIQ